MSGSSTAIAYINNKGAIKSKKCNELAKEIWLWYFKNNSFISAAHIPGKHNIKEDKFSRKFNNNTEWQLNPKIFIEITNKFGYSEIDLFATRITAQLQNYVSWSCEPEVKAVDAFLTDWGKQFSYIFPPFSLLRKVTSRIWQDKARCIVTIPRWTTQYWYHHNYWYHPVLVQRNHNQTCTKQPPATTRHKESRPITQDSDPNSSINTLEIVSSNDILQAALRPSTTLKHKTH